MKTSMNARLRVALVVNHYAPVAEGGVAPISMVELTLHAVTEQPFGPNGENSDNSFARWTPMADLKMTIQNPALFGKFKEGQKFSVTFDEIEEASVEQPPVSNECVAEGCEKFTSPPATGG